VNRRRVVTLNDGVPGERSISVACMHCSDAPCMAVCPVNCFYRTDEGVGPDTVFIPFHFSGWWQGEDMLPYYPEGAAPIVRGEAVNTATTYGYDRVTMMQETKTTLCNVAKA